MTSSYYRFSRKSLQDVRKNVSVLGLVPLTNPRRVPQDNGGVEITGGCGFCEECKSKPGIFTINPSKNVGFCRKYHKGVSSIDALALASGIIQCKELKDKNYSREQWHKILSEISKIEDD